MANDVDGKPNPEGIRASIFAHFDSRGGTVAVATGTEQEAREAYSLILDGLDPRQVWTAIRDQMRQYDSGEYAGEAILEGLVDWPVSGTDLEIDWSFVTEPIFGDELPLAVSKEQEEARDFLRQRPRFEVWADRDVQPGDGWEGTVRLRMVPAGQGLDGWFHPGWAEDAWSFALYHPYAVTPEMQEDDAAVNRAMWMASMGAMPH